MKTILITGAAGNLGGRLRAHMQGRYALRLLDAAPSGDPAILPADLRTWNPAWAQHFEGVDVAFHFALATGSTWETMTVPNLDITLNTFAAAARAGVPRVIYASSNHVLGGYKDLMEQVPLTTELPPRPGTRYLTAEGEVTDSTPYGAVKLAGERIGKSYAEIHDMTVIAVRLGSCRAAEPEVVDVSPQRNPWLEQMYLSNRDFCHLMERCIEADLGPGFLLVNGVSANTGSYWDLTTARHLLGYIPQDDVTRRT